MSPLNGKTILITGASGFVGQHLVNRLRAEKGARLVILSRKPASAQCEGVTWVHSSLEELSAETWRRSGVSNIDLVLHLGAFIPKSGAEVDRVAEVYQDNLLGTRALLGSLPSSPERIVFASTVDVYAPPVAGHPLSEASPVGPASLYGASKLFCEYLVRVCAKKFGCGFAILRYGHIFGPGEEAYAKLIPQMIRLFLRGEAPVLYGDGSTERDFLYVADAVEATLCAAMSDMAELGPVNIVRGDSVSIRELAGMLALITGYAGEVNYLADKPGGHSLRFDNQLMRDLLGEWDLVPLAEGLKCEVDHFRRLSE